MEDTSVPARRKIRLAEVQSSKLFSDLEPAEVFPNFPQDAAFVSTRLSDHSCRIIDMLQITAASKQCRCETKERIQCRIVEQRDLKPQQTKPALCSGVWQKGARKPKKDKTSKRQTASCFVHFVACASLRKKDIFRRNIFFLQAAERRCQTIAATANKDM